MFAFQLLILTRVTKDLRAALGCEVHCGKCPFQGLNENCPGRVLQRYIEEAEKKPREA